MKSLKNYISESAQYASSYAVSYAVSELRKCLDRYYVTGSKRYLTDIERILRGFGEGSVIKWGNHTAECVPPSRWNVDGSFWRTDLVPSEIAGWNAPPAEIEVEVKRQPDPELMDSDEELMDAAASTTYESSLRNYLRQAKSDRARNFIQKCLDDLRRRGKLE